MSILPFAYTVLFLLPFERIPSIDIYTLTVRLSSLVILAFLLVGVPWLWMQKKIVPFSYLDAAIGAYLLVALLSISVATDVSRATLVFLLLLFTVLGGYGLMSRTSRFHVAWDMVAHIVIWSALVTAVLGLLQFFGDVMGLPSTVTGFLPRYTKVVFGFPRLQSVGIEPLYYANFLLLPLSFIGAYITWQRATRFHYYAYILLLTTLILTLSRGAYIAYLGGMIFLTIAVRCYRLTLWPLARLIGLGIISLSLVALVIVSVSSKQGLVTFAKHVIAPQETRDTSIVPRLARYREALSIFALHPLLGVGLGNYGRVSRLPQEPGVPGPPIVNNQYLETLAETGMLGFLALLGVGIAVGRKLLVSLRSRKADVPAVALSLSFLGLVLQYNFFSTIYILFVWVVIGLIAALPPQSSELKG